jgi:hypothetical protein
LIEQAAALQKQTTFGDEAIIQAQGLLASFGSTEEQIKTLTPLILDYAAASGQDLSQAATKVNNILNGTSTTLRGTSIRLSETADANERYNAVLVEFNKFQGQASALADTQSGKLQQLENEYGDQQEVLGSKLIPVKVEFMELLIGLIDTVQKLFKGIGDIGYSFGRLFGVVESVNSAYDSNITATEKVNEQILETNENIASEEANLRRLFETLKDETASKAERERAIIQMNQSYAPYLHNIDLEKASIEELNTLEGQLINTMTKRIVLQRQEEQIAPLIEQRINLIDAISEVQKNQEEELNRLQNMTEEQRKFEAENAAMLEDLPKFFATRSGQLMDITGKTVQDLEAELEDVNKAIEDMNSSYDDLLGNLGETIEPMTAQTTATRAATDAMNEQAEAMEGPAAKAYDLATAADALTQAEKELAESLKSVDELLTDVNLSFPEEEIEEPPIVSQADLVAEKLGKVQAVLTALKGISLNDAINQFAAMDEETTNLEKTLVAVGASVTAINQVLDTRFANQKAKIEQQTLAEKEAIEQSTMSEEQKRIRIERAEQKKATALEKIERQQAKKQKANAVIQSIINTALGVTAALKNPVTAPFVIPFIVGIGAVQTGIIAAQQFAEGGQVAELGSGEGGVIAANLQNIPSLANGDNVLATVKTGEVILNDAQQNRLMQLTSPDIFRAIKVPNFADGGVVPSFQSSQQASTARIEAASQNVADTVQRIRVVNVASETQGMAVRVQNIEGEATLG